MTTDETTATALRFYRTGVEELFRMTDVTGDATRGVTEMTTGPWLADELGRPCRGCLGIPMDAVMGSLVTSAAPDGSWAVSTEIHLDFLLDPPTDGSTLSVESRPLGRGPGSGTAVGRVVDADGKLIASGSTRLHIVPVTDAPGSAVVPADAVDARRGATSIVELLGAEHRRNNGTAGLELGPAPVLANPMGNVHGGVLLCASEIAGLTALDSGKDFRTTSITISYLRPCPSDEPITLAPKVLHRGRSLVVVQVDSCNRAGKTCTTATVTCSAVH